MQAWDGADELLLEHLGTLDLGGMRILILNDEFGALSCALEGKDVTTYTDSYVSAQGLQENSGARLKAVPDLARIEEKFDLVVARIPKNLSFFEDLLARISAWLKPGASLVCGYRIKYQTKASFDLIGKYVGVTHTSLAQKKARLIFAKQERPPVPSPYPMTVKIDGFDAPWIHHSNLFSREKLDVGTRFFLEHIPEGAYRAVLDLGCANGILGIAAKLRHPEASVIFSDDSWMALESARANYARLFPDRPGDAEFRWLNCFENQPESSLDLVLCNPPFHQGTTLGDFIARQMFADAYRALRPGGLLRVIGNSHLHYGAALERLFGKSERVAKNAKFTIVDAIKKT